MKLLSCVLRSRKEVHNNRAGWRITAGGQRRDAHGTESIASPRRRKEAERDVCEGSHHVIWRIKAHDAQTAQNKLFPQNILRDDRNESDTLTFTRSPPESVFGCAAHFSPPVNVSCFKSVSIFVLEKQTETLRKIFCSVRIRQDLTAFGETLVCLLVWAETGKLD